MWLWWTKKLTEARAVAFKHGAEHDLFNSADGDALLDLIDDHLGAYEGIVPPFNPTFNYVVYTQKKIFLQNTINFYTIYCSCRQLSRISLKTILFLSTL